ncbi:hypothetical protein [Phormidesmis priestleyi]|uniref:hypothetical protein n=1 Tax=Phormidesmis priestleyi TaxID=268141 RepID=UPI00083B268B|nr:hypothetical protein [Phormidesmis priestleyi]
MTTDQTLNRIEQNLEILTVHVGRLTEGLTEFRADMAEIKDMIRQQFLANREFAETVRRQGEQQTAAIDRLSDQITRQGEQIARQGEQIARQGEQQEQASILFRQDLAEIKAMIRENADITRQQSDVVSRLTGIVEQLIQNRN